MRKFVSKIKHCTTVAKVTKLKLKLTVPIL